MGAIIGMNRRSRGLLLVAGLAAFAATLSQPSPVHALPPPYQPFVFNPAVAQQAGPEVFVYDWSVNKCGDYDIPDEPTRAFKDDTGKVQLWNQQPTNHRWIANTTLDSPYSHPCAIVMSSSGSCTASNFNYKEWLASPWTPDGKTIYALVHNEYYGQNCSSGCPSSNACWYNAITSAYSTDSGATFTQLAAPNQLVAANPYQFSQDGPNGYFAPSNTVRARDGYFYAMFRAEDKNLQQLGTCIMRTRDLSDPSSWRGWNGSSFTVQFINPYFVTTNPGAHICAPVDFNSIGTITESLTYNTYFRKWMLLGNSIGDPPNGKPPGVYFSLSDDLLDWTNATLLMEAEVRWATDCVPPDPIKDPSLLDPASTSRNFETVGQTGQLFYTWYHMDGCNGTWDRDLIRIPIQFTNQQPGGPAAAVSTSTRTPPVGEPVRFDGSRSADRNGSIRSYRWDLDGDGKFERNTGSNPRASKSYTAPGQVTVTMRVSDNDGKFTDDTQIVRVGR